MTDKKTAHVNKPVRVNVSLSVDLAKRLTRARADKQIAYIEQGKDLTLGALGRSIFDEWLTERGY